MSDETYNTQPEQQEQGIVVREGSDHGNNDAPAQGAGFPTNDRHKCVVFVGNLPFQTPWQKIKDEFARAGKVRYTDLVADKQGRPKGSALVTMANPEGATKAVEMFNEMDFGGRRIIVREFNDGPRPSIVQKDMMPEYRRRDAGAPRDNNGYPQKPVQQSNGQPNSWASKIRGGKNDPSAPASNPVPRPRSDGAKLFVSNLPFDCNATALRETFAQVGVVRHAEIITGRSGKSRGMGIVMMETSKAAALAISEFHGIEMAGRPMHVRLDHGSAQ